jgi:hypothetical protein
VFFFAIFSASMTEQLDRLHAHFMELLTLATSSSRPEASAVKEKLDGILMAAQDLEIRLKSVSFSHGDVCGQVAEKVHDWVMIVCARIPTLNSCIRNCERTNRTWR